MRFRFTWLDLDVSYLNESTPFPNLTKRSLDSFLIKDFETCELTVTPFDVDVDSHFDSAEDLVLRHGHLHIHDGGLGCEKQRKRPLENRGFWINHKRQHCLLKHSNVEELRNQIKSQDSSLLDVSVFETGWRSNHWRRPPLLFQETSLHLVCYSFLPDFLSFVSCGRQLTLGSVCSCSSMTRRRRRSSASTSCASPLGAWTWTKTSTDSRLSNAATVRFQLSEPCDRVWGLAFNQEFPWNESLPEKYDTGFFLEAN